MQDEKITTLEQTVLIQKVKPKQPAMKEPKNMTVTEEHVAYGARTHAASVGPYTATQIQAACEIVEAIRVVQGTLTGFEFSNADLIRDWSDRSDWTFGEVMERFFNSHDLEEGIAQKPGFAFEFFRAVAELDSE